MEYVVIRNRDGRSERIIGTVRAESLYKAAQRATEKWPAEKFGWSALTVREEKERDKKWK